MNRKALLRGQELRNTQEALSKPWMPGMSLGNANGAIDTSTLGFEYTIQTTTFIRARVIAQKFYRVAPADFMPIIIGQGAWMEDIKTNLTYDAAGNFSSGLIGTANGPSQIANVDVGTAPKTAKIHTWAKGYLYTVPEVQKALASNNWDVVSSKLEALKRNWDLGVQDIAFLGLLGQEDTTPGLLTNSEVTVDTTTIDQNISAMDDADFQAFVASVLTAYSNNAAQTVMPNVFAIPLADFLGLGAAASAGFPIGTKLNYLLQVFKEITGNAGFQIRGLAYGNKAINAGRVAVGGKFRYALYNNDPETLAMDIPVDFTLTPAGTSNNFQFQGVGAGQFSGCIVYRTPEVLYFDHE